MPVPSPPSILIIGGGLSGAALAWQLVRHAAAPLRVRVVGRDGAIGAGVAYRTSHPGHLLNVRTRAMSLDPDDAGHLMAWLHSRGAGAAQTWEASLDPDGFLPRGLYREYVAHALREAEANASEGVTLERIAGDAVDVTVIDGGATARLAGGEELQAQRIVLALGNPPPAHPTLEDLPFYGHDRYVRDPWSGRALSAIQSDEHVLVLGSNLTMFDIAVELAGREHRGKMTAVSRHGLLSATHGPASPAVPPFAPESAPRRLRALAREIRNRVREAEARGTGWRAVVDGLRPDVSSLWSGFSDTERRRFAAHARPFWDIHRHRAPQEVVSLIERLRSSGQLTVRAGRIRHFEVDRDRVIVTLVPRGSSHAERMVADRVINATGPEADYRRVSDPLPRQLFAKTYARPGSLGMGFDATDEGAILDAGGRRSAVFSTLGPTLRGVLWETTAVPEIRVQARALASRLLTELS